ncbi:MAG: DUF2809 domain-containing protein [Bryobacteraceae bacterium]|jgi:hypothetical protein
MVAGLTIRFAHLGLPPLVVKYGGSTLWALMIYWIVSAPVPARRLLLATLVAGTIATAVEFLKLYHSPSLDAFRRTLPGIILLGRIFSAWDIATYWIAIAIGALLDSSLRSAAARSAE